MIPTLKRHAASRVLSGLALSGVLLTAAATNTTASASQSADTSSGTRAAQAATPLQRADFLMNRTYGQFPAYAQHREAPFDWNTDGCTGTPWPWSKVFRAACVMHDFGYRNYGRQGTTRLQLDPTDNRRKWIDDRLLQEMKRICNDGRLGIPCKTAAVTIHRAVRIGGGRYFF